MRLAVIILKAWAHMLHMFNMAATSFAIRIDRSDCLAQTFANVVFLTLFVCIESTFYVYRIDIDVSRPLQFVSNRLVSKRLLYQNDGKPKKPRTAISLMLFYISLKHTQP